MEDVSVSIVSFDSSVTRLSCVIWEEECQNRGGERLDDCMWWNCGTEVFWYDWAMARDISMLSINLDAR